MMQVTFFDPSHFEALIAAFQDMGQHYFGHAAPNAETVRLALANEILGQDSDVRLVVASDGSQVAGFATFAILYPAPGLKGQMFMKDLYVCSAWRSQGIGEEIMRFLAAYALEKGCVRFDWTAEDTNHPAIAFYERLGAHKVQEKIYFRLTQSEIQALATKLPEDSAHPDAHSGKLS